MTSPFSHVNRGDLITAKFMNDLLDQVSQLDSRLRALEGGNGGAGQGNLDVTGLVPASGPYTVGQELQIIGHNFGFSRGAQQVLFGNVRVDLYKPASNDSLLVMDIPDIPGLPAGGAVALLTVSNFDHSVSRNITVQPAQASQNGVVDVQWVEVSPPNVNPTQDVVHFRYRLQSRAASQVICAIDPQITLAGAQPQPQAGAQLRVLDRDLQPIQSRQIPISPSETKEFFIELPVTAGMAVGTAFTLTVNVSGIGVDTSSAVHDFTVGQPTAPPDSTITLSLNSDAVTPAGAFDAGVNTLTLSSAAIGAAGVGFLPFTVGFTKPGNYNVSATPTANATGWTVVLSETPPQFVIQESDIPTGSQAERPVRVRVRPSASATTPAQLTVSIENADTNQKQTRQITLVRS